MNHKKNIIFFLASLIIFIAFIYWFNSPSRFTFYGNTSLSSGKAAKAVNILEQGLRCYPGNSRIIFSLAKAYLSLEETEKANKILSDGVISLFQRNKNFQDFLLDLSEANYRLNNLHFARYFVTKYLASQDVSEASRRVIKNYIRAGQILPDKSFELWEKGYNIAFALKEKELKESLKALLLPKYIQLVEELRSRKNYKEALEVLNKSKIFGKSADVTYQEAVILAELEKVDLALKKFEDALQLDPTNDNYRITYANVLKKLALHTKEPQKKKAYLEKIKLLLVSGEDNPKKTNFLNKIISLNTKYKVVNDDLKITSVGDYKYPSLEFKIIPLSDIKLKKYKIVFFDDNKRQLDIYETPFTENDADQLIEVTCKNPVTSSNIAVAKLFLNDEFVKEYTNK